MQIAKFYFMKFEGKSMGYAFFFCPKSKH